MGLPLQEMSGETKLSFPPVRFQVSRSIIIGSTILGEGVTALNSSQTDLTHELGVWWAPGEGPLFLGPHPDVWAARQVGGWGIYALAGMSQEALV